MSTKYLLERRNLSQPTNRTIAFVAQALPYKTYQEDCSGEPVCLQIAEMTNDCAEFEYANCDLFSGCSWESVSNLEPWNGNCVGTRPPCKERDEESCDVTNHCGWDWDPPCSSDTFHKAIEPVSFGPFCDVNLEVTVPNVTEASTVIANGACCGKKRPSRDGVVEYMAAEQAFPLFRACSMWIEGKACRSCELCTTDTYYRGLDGPVAYDCGNLVSPIIEDDECSGDLRCVGQDCNGNCICRDAASADIGEPTPGPLSTAVPTREPTLASTPSLTTGQALTPAASTPFQTPGPTPGATDSGASIEQPDTRRFFCCCTVNTFQVLSTTDTCSSRYLIR